MIFIILFLEFFKTGLFAIGGGLATIPFLQEMLYKYEWFSSAELSNMLAISESTPGAIGINMSTYVGYTVGNNQFGVVGGIFGGITTTFGLVLPSLIIIIVISKYLSKFTDKPIVKSAFYGIRPAVAGLIAVSAFTMLTNSVLFIDKFLVSYSFSDLIDIKTTLLFIVLFISIRKSKLHPAIFILLSAVFGILFL